MINIFNFFKKNNSSQQSRQALLLEFVHNKENLKKAAKGSMEKRLELIDKAVSGQPA